MDSYSLKVQIADAIASVLEKDQTCRWCKWWRKEYAHDKNYRLSVYDRQNAVEMMEYECHGNAPVSLPSSSHGSMYTHWPRTAGYGTCSKWEKWI